MNEYTVGSLVKVVGTWVDSLGNKVDPSAITISYITPTKVLTTFIYGEDSELIREEVGVYSTNIFIDECGTWIYRFVGTGNAVAAKAGRFNILRCEFL